MIDIDGSQGEGGGQVLRSALALSILTGQPMRVKKIRARRSNPGLRPQHLKAVDAAAAISKARVEGVYKGSTSVVFAPGQIRSGRYRFDIGTAGSVSLVLQTIFLPLSMAGSASSVIITGGTHVPWAPCFHYLNMQWLPFMRIMGFEAQFTLSKAGFYPQGGGRIDAIIRPVEEILPIKLTQRGSLSRIDGISAVSNLKLSIADRQRRQTLRHLQNYDCVKKIKIAEMPSKFKGTLLLLRSTFGPTKNDVSAQCCFYALGELGKPAEKVADETVKALESFLATDGVVDHYLADQLLLPMAFASGASEIHTSKVTQHLLTNAAIIRAFIPLQIDIQGETGQPGRIKVDPRKPIGGN